MKCLLVIDSLGSGGAQRQITLLAEEFRRRGIDVDVFVYHPEGDFFRDRILACGARIIEMKKIRRFSMDVVFRLRRLFRESSYDGIIAFLVTPSLYAELARAPRTDPRLIVSYRASFPIQPPLRLRLLNQFHCFADAIVTNSATSSETMGNVTPFLRDRLRVIYNGVDLSQYEAGPVRPVEESLSILCVGTIYGVKNGLNLARALVMHRDRNPKLRVRLSWAGKSPVDRDGMAYHRQLIDYVERESLDWEWLGERSDVPQLLSDCHCLVHPSLHEGLPNAVCEALAAGRPVLVSNVCDHPRLVKEGVTGFLFVPTDPESIQSALARFCKLSDTERSGMGEAARLYAESELSCARMGDSFLDILQDNN